MKIDEAFFENVGEDAKAYSTGVILPDGQYILTKEGHLHTLLGLVDIPKEQVWEMVPKDDSVLFWLIDYTGCVITDDYSSVGEAMTSQQKKTYSALVEHGVIADKYFDITEERKRAAARA